MTYEIDNKIAETLARIHGHVAKQVHEGKLDELTMKEVRLRGLEQTERVMANDEKASIISIVAYVVVT